MNSTTQKLAGAGIFALTVAGLSVAGAGAAQAVVLGPTTDSYLGTVDTMLSVDAASGVLANDDCFGGVATVGGVSNFVNGELDMHADGSFDYTPAAGYTGPRTFDYDLLCDGAAGGTATVNLVFSPVVPVGQDDYYTTPQDTTLTVAANGVMANDPTATAVVDAQNLPDGLIPQYDGSFVYTPPAGFVGDVTWSYRMSDGGDTLSDWIFVTISVTPVAQVIPADDVETELPTLAYTGAGDVSTWLLAPAAVLLGLGAAGAYVARRRAQLS